MPVTTRWCQHRNSRNVQQPTGKNRTPVQRPGHHGTRHGSVLCLNRPAHLGTSMSRQVGTITQRPCSCGPMEHKPRPGTHLEPTCNLQCAASRDMAQVRTAMRKPLRPLQRHGTAVPLPPPISSPQYQHTSALCTQRTALMSTHTANHAFVVVRCYIDTHPAWSTPASHQHRFAGPAKRCAHATAQNHRS